MSEAYSTASTFLFLCLSSTVQNNNSLQFQSNSWQLKHSHELYSIIPYKNPQEVHRPVCLSPSDKENSKKHSSLPPEAPELGFLENQSARSSGLGQLPAQSRVRPGLPVQGPFLRHRSLKVRHISS